MQGVRCAGVGVVVIAAGVAQEPSMRLFEFEGVAGGRLGSALERVDATPARCAVGAPRAAPSGVAMGRVELRSMSTGALEWSVAGAWPWAEFGASIADAGPRAAGGEPALWVGAPGDLGRVVLVDSGGSMGVELTGPEDHARFGAALAALGDLDGDGIDDVAVGAPGFDGGALQRGWVGVFSGSDGALRWSVSGEPFDHLGVSLDSIADVDGDGLREVVIGSPFADGFGFNFGAVELRSGGDGGLLWRAFGSASGDRTGERVAAAGDVDGDGVEDVIAGAPGADSGGADSGGARVFSGLDGKLLLELSGFAAGEFAAAVAGLGDVDGDGRSEVVLGSSAADGGRGRVRIVSGADGSLVVDLLGEEPNGWLGATLEGLGDLNADDRPELAVGAPGHDDHPELVGRALVLSSASLDLWSDGHAVPPGATQRIEGEFPGRGGDVYYVLGSLTGTAPGFALAEHAVALTPDLYFVLVLQGVAPIEVHTGVVDPSGRVTFDFTPPPSAAAVGPFAAWHACLLRDPLTSAPSAVSVSVPAWIE